jgi:glycosyltransferase involved in cell wall biosynthesis
VSTATFVSIVLPTYNRAHLLPRSIDSVLAQTYFEWELIVVDDRSIDATRAVVREYASRDSRIRYVENTHKQGCAGARNQGCEAAGAGFIAFIDSDDKWKPYHLRAIMEHFAGNADVDWIYADSEIVEDGVVVMRSVFHELWKNRKELRVSQRGALSVIDDDGLLEHAIQHGLYAACQSSVMRKRLFETTTFDEDLQATEDWLFALEIIYKGYRLAYLNDVHFTYVLHPHSISANPRSKTVHENLMVYEEFEKFYQIVPQRMALTRAQQLVVRKRLADMYFWFFCRSGYLRLGDYRTAHRYLSKCIRLTPLRVLFWREYLLNMMRMVRQPPGVVIGNGRMPRSPDQRP